MRSLLAAALLLSTVALAQGAPPVPPVPAAPAVPPMPAMGARLFHTPGIPPQVAQKLGLSPEVVKKVRDLGFEANEQLIALEADLKRAQLELEKTMVQPNVDEGQALARVEQVGKAELLVRKNRVGLMLRIRKLLGPETWDRLQAEFPGPGEGLMMGAPGSGVRREVRVIKRGDGTTDVTDNVSGLNE
jgi:Spy/CpxP family protein refolding chaperone